MAASIVLLRDPPPVPTTAPVPDAATWSAPTRFAFRFFLVHFALWCFPFPLDLIPGVRGLFGWWQAGWSALTGVIGRLLELGPLQPGQFYGSSDGLLAWVSHGTMAALALVGAIVWSLLDRRRRAYPRLYAGLHLWVRWFLAVKMLLYGLAKVMPIQFPHLNSRMVEPFGQASPMGLLWTFMAEGRPYAIFAGAVEMLGALLLLSRRTATLGALILVGAMTNIVALNYSYDVDVKLDSSLFLVTALFLLAPDARRLADVVLFDRPTVPAPRPRIASARWRWSARGAGVVGVAFLGYYAWTTLNGFAAEDGSPMPFAGVWEVAEVVRGGQAAANGARWQRVGFDNGMFGVARADGAYQLYGANHRPKTQRLWFEAPDADAPMSSMLHYDLGSGELILDGLVDNELIWMRLVPAAPSSLPLRTRGFHWVSEWAFNR